jgi:hypothetical protein
MNRRKGETQDQPLWGDHWRHGSFWDDLARLRARIKTASAALMDPGEQTAVSVTLGDIATNLEELSQKAQKELEGLCG